MRRLTIFEILSSNLTLLLVLLLPAGLGQNSSADRAQPGTINYVEGQVSSGAKSLEKGDCGSVVLAEGQYLKTEVGRVEILLTPGTFFRLAEESSAVITFTDIANTTIQVSRGRALVEIVELDKQSGTQVRLNGLSVIPLRKGLYDFDADRGAVRVLTGKAEIYVGRWKVKLKDQQRLGADSFFRPRAESFDPLPYEDDFFRWSALRSGYLSEASADEARAYIGVVRGSYGPGWDGPGWYWDPWFQSWTFVSAKAIRYSPFGWGFFSPVVVYRSPFSYGGYFGRGPHHFDELHYPYGHGFDRDLVEAFRRSRM